MGCSVEDELATEVFVPLDTEAMDRARKTLARIVSSSPAPNLHPNALRRMVARLTDCGSQPPTELPIKSVLPRVVLCSWVARSNR